MNLSFADYILIVSKIKEEEPPLPGDSPSLFNILDL